MSGYLERRQKSGRCIQDGRGALKADGALPAAQARHRTRRLNAVASIVNSAPTLFRPRSKKRRARSSSLMMPKIGSVPSAGHSESSPAPLPSTGVAYGEGHFWARSRSRVLCEHLSCGCRTQDRHGTRFWKFGRLERVLVSCRYACLALERGAAVLEGIHSSP